MTINQAFRSIFSTDMDLISDDVPPIQLEINAEHNTRNIGTARSDHIVIKHDALMRSALTPRQL